MKEALSLGNGISLIKRTLTPQSQRSTGQPSLSTHHLLIIDCSGSMWGELSQIRGDLYNKISTILQPQDSVSILWFSGRGQFGVIVENYKNQSDNSLKNLRVVLERELQPKGLTAFKDPLVEAAAVIERVNNTDSNFVHSLFFLTDGYDNSYSDSEILQSVNAFKDQLVSASIVEYGYYCNKRLLNLMATEIGGNHVFFQDFQDYEPIMSNQFSQQVMSKRQYVDIDDQPTEGICFTIENGSVISYGVNDGQIFIDPEVDSPLYYITNDAQTSLLTENDMNLQDSDNDFATGMYAAMYAFSRRSDYGMISQILRVLGDAYLIRKKANTFGTQKNNELEKEILDSMNYPTLRFKEGYDPNAEPAEDAYCVMDMLDDLMSNEDNVWYPMHPEFQYKRVGRKSVSSGRKVSDEERAEVQALLENNSIEDAISRLQEIKEDEPDVLKFVNEDRAVGQTFSNLVWNKSRANLSVQVMYKGCVNLPTNDFENLPEGRFDTVIYRNYTIIKDGVINTYRLPVSLSEDTFNTLQENGLLEGKKYNSSEIYILDFSDLPVINQKMVSQSSAKELFENQYRLLQLQAKNTVFNHFKKRYLVASTKGFKENYGEEAAAWLKSLGLADYGFNPPSTLEKSEEETFVNTLEVKIKGLTLPNTKKDFDSVLSKLENGNELTGREQLLVPAIQEFQTFEKLTDGLTDEKKQAMVEEWVSEKSKSFRSEKTRLMNSVSKSKFLTIVGKSWFSDLESREEKKMILEMDNEEREFIIEDKLSKIKI
jgi:Mg-chelatase subunit ChlD